MGKWATEIWTIHVICPDYTTKFMREALLEEFGENCGKLRKIDIEVHTLLGGELENLHLFCDFLIVKYKLCLKLSFTLFFIKKTW